jgi:hypothetical protein
MPLPKIDLPTYEFELPSSGKKIKFRPFLVKEQKILLMALEAGKEADVIGAVKQIVTNCIVEENFDVNDMSAFDIEYFFINLRARSIGEKMALNFKCKNIVEEKECGHNMQVEHDVLSAKIEKQPDHNKTIFFSKDVGVVMKYPSMKLAENLVLKAKAKQKNLSETEIAMDMIVDCVDYFFEKDNIFYINEMSREEVRDYIENIPKSSLDQIEKFFQTMPTVKSLVEHKCEKCGFEHKIPIEGLISFFG